MIILQVNGRRVELDSPTPLLEYLRRLGVHERSVAVEVNGEILDRDTYAGRRLGPGDVVEIVRMVGGGCRARPPECSTFYKLTGGSVLPG